MALADIGPVVDAPPIGETPAPLSSRSERQVAQADRLIAEQRYTEAALELDRALRYEPDHPRLHLALARLHWQAGNIERARSHAVRAIESHPGGAEGHYVAARCAMAGGETVEAIQAFRAALQCADFESHSETAALTRFHLAEALRAEGYLEAALVQYAAFESSAASLTSTANDTELANLLRVNRGSAAEPKSAVLELLGRFDEAADCFAPLVSSAAPGNVQAAVRHTRLLMRAGRLREAVVSVEAIDSNEPGVLELLQELHLRVGGPDQLVEVLRKRLANRPKDLRLVSSLADALEMAGRNDDARRELSDYLAENPDADSVRERLIELLISSEAWNDLLSVCESGARRNPDRAEEFGEKLASISNRAGAVEMLAASGEGESTTSLYLRGRLASAGNLPARAESLFRAALQADNKFMPARAALADLLVKSYRYEEARRIVAREQEDVPQDARLERLLGRIHERLDDLKQAEVHFRAAMELDRFDTRSMLDLAAVHRAANRPLQAERQLQILLARDPQHDAAREMLAHVYLEQGKLDAATEQVVELRGRSQDVLLKARCGALLTMVQRRDAVAYREELRRALAEGTPDAETWLALAESYGEFEQTEAREAYLNALTLRPDEEEALLGVIFAEQRLLEFESAISRMEALLPSRPNRHTWRLGSAGSTWRMGLIELYRAVQDQEAALQLARSQAEREDIDDRTRALYRFAQLDALRDSGRSEEVLEHLRVWSKEGADRAWTMRLAAEYLRQNRAADALPLYQRAHQEDSENRGLRADFLDALVAAGRVDRACQYALDWMNDDPEGEESLGMLIAVLAGAKRIDDALELARNRLHLTRERERIQDTIINLLALGDRFRDGVDYVESLMNEIMQAMQAVQEAPARRGADRRPAAKQLLQPDDPSNLGALYGRLEQLRLRQLAFLLEAKDVREAQDRINHWLAESRDPEARFRYLVFLASSYQEQGRSPLVGSTLERALALKPDDVQLNNDVAYGWIDQGRYLRRAERMIRYSLSRSPRQAAYLDTYGWLLYKTGAFVEARKWLDRAVRAGQRPDPVILDHFGDACWRQGEREEAVRRWEQAIAAVAERPEDEQSADERRVRAETPKKIAEGKSSGNPLVADLAEPGAMEEEGEEIDVDPDDERNKAGDPRP